MKTTSALLSLVLLGAVGAGGYWLGTRATHGALPAATGASPTATAAASATVAAPARKLLYYRNPMGLPDISQVPKKDSMDMDYVPVYEGEDTAAASGDPGAAGRVTLETFDVLATPELELKKVSSYGADGKLQRLVRTQGGNLGPGEATYEYAGGELVRARGALMGELMAPSNDAVAIYVYAR